MTRLFAFWLLLGSVIAPLQAAPKAELWPFWQAANESNSATINHAPWQQLLDRYLDANHPSGINRFDYAAVSKQDQAKLNSYLAQLQQLDPRAYSKAEQFAYWVNLYNAATVAKVLAAYPVDSILKVDGGLFRRGPWNKKYFSIAGQAVSLNDIEHRILRPIWQDERIHYAVNCASLGCPNLLPTVFQADQLEKQLDQATRDYLQHPRGLIVQPNGELLLSKIFDWYQMDFGADESALLEQLKPQLTSAQRRELERFNGRIRYHYDWSLNQP